jgi:hypothetical protein
MASQPPVWPGLICCGLPQRKYFGVRGGVGIGFPLVMRPRYYLPLGIYDDGADGNVCSLGGQFGLDEGLRHKLLPNHISLTAQVGWEHGNSLGLLR